MIDFNKMISRHLERENKPKQIGRYYPSEIGGCMRKTWYSYKHPQQIDIELAKIFEVGNIVHGFVVEVLKSEKNKEIELLKTEMPFKQDFGEFVVSGRVDDLVLIKENGKGVLIEVKSTKSLEFVKKAQESHRMQLQYYMHATGVHNGMVLYVDKNNLQSKIFEVAFSEKESEEIIQRFKNLHSCLANELLPLPEAKKNPEKNWMCKFCEYAEKCGKNEQ
ncbi:MAG: Dna2/Cas4 domain-containing protein [Candidatus ainarchaeum sp.]|nr:Dna2/Cas4 domain-containing protein [Candidatus ainarchaeum sp.]